MKWSEVIMMLEDVPIGAGFVTKMHCDMFVSGESPTFPPLYIKMDRGNTKWENKDDMVVFDTQTARIGWDYPHTEVYLLVGE